MKKPLQALPRAFRVLLVDDNSHGLIARRSVLEEMGLGVSTATCGSEALELLSGGDYHLMVTDFRMPGMDGVELIRWARRAQPDLKVILLSGFVEPLGLTEQSTGADEVIAKSAGEVNLLVRSVIRLLTRKPPASVRESTRAKRDRAGLP
jgi:CheY-like chemotaxis protein